VDNSWVTFETGFIHRVCTAAPSVIKVVWLRIFHYKSLFYKVFMELSTGPVALYNNNKY
jgi:hypothetical protein